MVFPIDPSLSKPIILTPHGPEYKKPIPTIPPKKVNKKENTKPQAPKASGQRDYGTGEIQKLIMDYSAIYGIDPVTPLCIAKLESEFNPNAKNKRSTASGVFQYLNSTWSSTDEGKLGLSVFNADANIKAAIKYMAIHKSTKAWTVATSCPPLSSL